MTSSNSNGASVSYTYDDVGRLSTVVDNRLSGNNTTTYTYDAASNVATATLPNGLQSTFNYDSLNRLTAMTTPVSGYIYQLGPTGNRTSATELNGRTLNWSYDGIYRLTNETIGNDPANKDGSVAYGLDPVGNRKSGNNTTTYAYDPASNVTTATLPNGVQSAMTYDALNRITGLAASSSAAVAFNRPVSSLCARRELMPRF